MVSFANNASHGFGGGRERERRGYRETSHFKQIIYLTYFSMILDHSQQRRISPYQYDLHGLADRPGLPGGICMAWLFLYTCPPSGICMLRLVGFCTTNHNNGRQRTHIISLCRSRFCDVNAHANALRAYCGGGAIRISRYNSPHKSSNE